MIRIQDGSDEIEVRFCHLMCDALYLASITGVYVDEDRRCSSATIKINGQIVSTGIAICNPIDNFCKAIGRKKALKWALASLSKKNRTAIWNRYGIMCGF